MILLSPHKGSLLLAYLFHQSVNGWVEAIPFYPRSAGSLALFLVVVSVLTAGALLVSWRWSRSHRRQDSRAGEARDGLVKAGPSASTDQVKNG